jgi:hypothetical protein
MVAPLLVDEFWLLLAVVTPAGDLSTLGLLDVSAVPPTGHIDRYPRNTRVP